MEGTPWIRQGNKTKEGMRKEVRNVLKILAPYQIWVGRLSS